MAAFLKLNRTCQWRQKMLVMAFALGATGANSSLSAQTVVTHDASGYFRTARLSSNAAPIILAHPRSAVAPASADVAFGVSAVGSPPLVYTWQFNSNNIPGAMTDSLLLTNVTLADFGAYRVIVSNAFGSATSSNALLQLDSDRDGLPDAWEITYFGGITNRNGFQDFDQDGISDLDEFLEGTNPKNFN